MNSTTPRSFTETVEMENKERQFTLICGSDSELVRRIREAKDPASSGALASDLAGSEVRLPEWHGVYSPDRLAMLQGLRFLHEAGKSPQSSATARQDLQRAAKAFEVVLHAQQDSSTIFPKTISNAVQPKQETAFQAKQEPDLDTFRLLSESHSPDVVDLVWDWYQDRRGKLPARRSCVTPILGACITGNEKTDGAVYWLTVDLFDRQHEGAHHDANAPAGFYPLIAEMGLTLLDPAFLQAMSSVWNSTGLGARFRGRYCIRTSPPFDNSKLQLHRTMTPELQFPQQFVGSSAQGALLCALLSTSGDPYRHQKVDADLPAPESLELLTALTAAVDLSTLGADRPVKEWMLKSVGSLPAKLDAAFTPGVTGLRGVVFVQDDLTSSVNTEWADVLNEHEANAKLPAEERNKLPERYYIETVATVEQALDAILVTNQHLRRWHDLQRVPWESRWRPGTADLQSMLAAATPPTAAPPSEN